MSRTRTRRVAGLVPALAGVLSLRGAAIADGLDALLRVEGHPDGPVPPLADADGRPLAIEPPGTACGGCGAEARDEERAPVVASGDGPACPTCGGVGTGAAAVVRLGAYRGPLADLVRSVKDGRRRADRAAALGRRLAERVGEEGVRIPPELVVVPMPTPGPRRRERGLDHTAILADGVASGLRRPSRRWLVARGRHDRQAALGAAARRSREREVAPEVRRVARGPLSHGRPVLLVDDVLTTGATARAAIRVLARAGVGQILLGVVAVTPPPKMCRLPFREG